LAGDTADAARWWQQAHRALMPDYNRAATTYWWLMFGLGVAAMGYTVWALRGASTAELLQIGAGVVIAMLAGFFPVHIPRSKNSFAAGEIFIFLLLLMFGPAAAALASAGEGAVGAWRTSKRWTSRLLTPASACLSMLIAGSMLHAALDALKAWGLYGATTLMMVGVGCALLHFVLNTLMVIAVPFLKRRQWPTLPEMFGNFGWIGITFAGSSSIASLLFLTYKATGIGVLMAAVPILGLLLTTLHFVFRQQAADEKVRTNQFDAMVREADLAAQHLAQLKASEQRFHSAFTHASIGMALVSFDGQVLQVNAALRDLLGLGTDADMTSQDFGSFVVTSDRPALDDWLVQMRAQQIQSFAMELRFSHAAGHELWAAVNGSFFAERDTATPCLIFQVQDISARRHAEAELQHIAFHDALTGLPNRRQFQEKLAHALNDARGHAQRQFGLLFLDFDRFKLINDSLGHAVGDEFLIAVAQRIQSQIRPGDMLARLGGDEFAILAQGIDCEPYAVALANRLMEALRLPFELAGTDITTSASVGITFSGMGYATPAEMLRDADTAMYKAKSAGKARYALFDTALHTEVSHRLRLEGDLRRALTTGQLSVAYQPLVELASRRVIGFEALARWNHPELGAVSPATFIAVAEESGLITQLTDVVMRQACTQLRQWQCSDVAFSELTMNVNISGQDIAHPAFVERVTMALAEARLEPQHLTLELTENILMERLEAARPALTRLRRLGMGLSIDDFGTGYSSLRHLSKLPVSSLKIDRAFIADLAHGTDEAAVVESILFLGKSLGKAIFAEGIETAEQIEQLLRMGCTQGQGYHLSRPLSVEQADAMLAGLSTQRQGAASSQHMERVELLH
jgi:diguanylate cyclase (GGDEF)-like protein/PAS domain S-box-containing protein